MFIYALSLYFSTPIDLEWFSDAILELEESLLALWKKIEYSFEENSFILYNLDFQDKEDISFREYMDEWKVLKNFLLKNNLATEENYKSFFKMIKIEQKTEEIPTADKLDALIAKVDKNDPKLLDVLNKIEKIKNKN